jgi:hypothetical protein
MTTTSIPITNGSFSFTGQVVRSSGAIGGSLHWTGTWASPYDAGGIVRLTKGTCSSPRAPYATALSLPVTIPPQVAGPGVALSWGPVPNAAS